MALMEEASNNNNNNNHDPASSYSWWWDSHNCSNNQSQWLQNTLSDLDKKTKVMLNLIEDDGDSFAKRAEMYYKRKPELIEMVEDLHRSHRSLAEKYDQLKFESIQADNLKSISNSMSSKQGIKLEPPNSSPKSEIESNKLYKNVEIMRMQVSKLVEDNLRHQDELIKRNDEKREVINKLMDENKALKSRLNYVESKKNKSQMSRLKRLFRGKVSHA